MLKDVVYSKGNDKQVAHLANLGGMSEEEREVFIALHEGHSDLRIQEDMSMSRKSYSRVEDSVRAKLLLAVFDCINSSMNQ